MSAELLPISEPHGNNEAHGEIPVGGSKPLHRFLKGQPKITGTIVLIMGASFVVVSAAITTGHWRGYMWAVIPPSIFLGVLFIVSGILYILTAHNLTKKTVTISLALSIVTILGACWSFIRILGDLHFYIDMHEYEVMGMTIEVVVLVYIVVGTVIFIIMSVFAGVALRSTKTQAVVVVNMTPVE
ncbi:uncharacterized protein si:ch1073-291c23.2 isoform X2 [Nematolebias whitei]|uniref:uncharacterized protein si:ch1073-291c23.2 isoform X2 n=1 Tax=Nematolebias whitei TaxID=451745 RepID=UPI00189731CE|nr:uncharacterized protein si:ch1073-291c23.2 isoform X2 [Nematolebias whitei]